MNETAARARIAQRTAADREPVLTSDELDDLVTAARRPDSFGYRFDGRSVWTAASAYVVGDVVVPTTRNGHFYEVTVSDGAAGAVEPVWPTDDGATVTKDGVTYAEAGAAPYVETWDLNYAIAEGWGMKASKVAGDFDYSDDAGSYSRQQVFEMCKRQEADYRKKVLGSLPVSKVDPATFEELGVLG